MSLVDDNVRWSTALVEKLAIEFNKCLIGNDSQACSTFPTCSALLAQGTVALNNEWTREGHRAFVAAEAL